MALTFPNNRKQNQFMPSGAPTIGPPPPMPPQQRVTQVSSAPTIAPPEQVGLPQVEEQEELSGLINTGQTPPPQVSTPSVPPPPPPVVNNTPPPTQAQLTPAQVAALYPGSIPGGQPGHIPAMGATGPMGVDVPDPVTSQSPPASQVNDAGGYAGPSSWTPPAPGSFTPSAGTQYYQDISQPPPGWTFEAATNEWVLPNGMRQQGSASDTPWASMRSYSEGDTLPDGRVIPVGGSYDPLSGKILNGLAPNLWSYDLANNPNLGTTLGWMGAWNNGNPTVDGPWTAEAHYLANEGANGTDGGMQYGPGTMVNGQLLPDSYGYIGAGNDPFIDEDLSSLINTGSTPPFGFGGNLPPLVSPPVDPGMGGPGGDPTVIDTGHVPPVGFPGTPPVVTPPPVTPPSLPASQPSDPQPPTPQPGTVPDIGSEDQELRDLIRDRADNDPSMGGSDSDELMALFNEGADAVRARTRRNREEGLQSIAEVMSARGTVGGSPEFSELGDLEERLFLAEQEGLSDLNRERYGFALQGRAQDLQKYGIDANLAYNYAALEQDAGFRETAFELQATGMQLDEAYRYAAMSQDSNFRQQALNLQSQGMQMDDAYRYAALSQDSRFRQLALDLQTRGLNIQEAYQAAALAWDKERFAGEQGLQREGLTIDKQRLRAQILDMILRNELDLNSLPPEIRAALNL